MVVFVFFISVAEEGYEILVSLVAGTFQKAKNERFRVEKAAVLKF